MGPTIGRSIGQGFRAANASWAGMAVFGAGWLLVGLVAVGGVALTSPPQEVFEGRGIAIPEATIPDLGEPEAPAAPEAAAPDAAAPETIAPETAVSPEASEAQTPTLFEELETTPEAAPAEPSVAGLEPPAPALGELEAADDARRDRLFNEWVRRAWPILLVCAVLVLGAGVWLNGGQIGYLVLRVRTGQAKVADLWRTGTKAFGALMGGWVLSLLGFGVVLLSVSVFGFVFQALPNAIPDWLVTLLTIIIVVGVVGASIWLFVRLSFWFIAIVADAVGPITGLKASFRATRGRWWKVAALGLLAILVSYAALIPSMVLEWLGGLARGPAGFVLGILASVAGVVAGLYTGFAVLAAYIRFYEDVKPAAAAPASMTP